MFLSTPTPARAERQRHRERERDFRCRDKTDEQKDGLLRVMTVQHISPPPPSHSPNCAIIVKLRDAGGRISPLHVAPTTSVTGQAVDGCAML